MNQSRRQFIGQCATMVGAYAMSGMIGRMPASGTQDQPLVNWAGNYRYSTQRITSPTSLPQLQEFVRKHERFKVLGTRNCFNGIDDSADHLLSLRELKQVVELDRASRKVTIESGMSYGQLSPYLDQQGIRAPQSSPRCRISQLPARVPPRRTAPARGTGTSRRRFLHSRL